MLLKAVVVKKDDIVELKLAVGKYDDMVESKLAVCKNDGNVLVMFVNDVSWPFSRVVMVLLYVDNGVYDDKLLVNVLLNAVVVKYEPMVELKLAVGKYDDMVELKLAVCRNDGNVLVMFDNDVSWPFSRVAMVLLYVVNGVYKFKLNVKVLLNSVVVR